MFNARIGNLNLEDILVTATLRSVSMESYRNSPGLGRNTQFQSTEFVFHPTLDVTDYRSLGPWVHLSSSWLWHCRLWPSMETSMEILTKVVKFLIPDHRPASLGEIFWLMLKPAWFLQEKMALFTSSPIEAKQYVTFVFETNLDLDHLLVLKQRKHTNHGHVISVCIRHHTRLK